MSDVSVQRVLFTGYAPVHFICFRPLYERLKSLAHVHVSLSGGIRTRTRTGFRYDEKSMYRGFGLPSERVLSVDQIKGRRFDVLFAANTRVIEPRSATTKIQIFHGVSFRNKAIRPANMGCDYYLLVGPYMRRRFIEAGLLRERDHRGVPIGFMKTDRLLNGELDRPRLLAELGLGGERPILLYAPTGARRNSFETMGEEVVRRLAASEKYDLLIKLHDHPKRHDAEALERLGRRDDAHCRLVRAPDVVPFLYLADLLITDASSVASEYALLDRPVVFLDVPELISQARAAAHSMLDLETWGRRTGTLVTNPAEVEAAVERSLAAPGERTEVRKAMAKDLFYHPGSATEAAMCWLREHVLRPGIGR